MGSSSSSEKRSADGSQSPSPPVAGAQPESPPAPPSHQMDSDEDDDNVKQLNECSTLYLALQDCLVRTDRNWKSCQPEVQALKACHSRKNNAKDK